MLLITLVNIKGDQTIYLVYLQHRNIGVVPLLNMRVKHGVVPQHQHGAGLNMGSRRNVGSCLNISMERLDRARRY